jgi:hypothetical protein
MPFDHLLVLQAVCVLSRERLDVFVPVEKVAREAKLSRIRVQLAAKALKKDGYLADAIAPDLLALTASGLAAAA